MQVNKEEIRVLPSVFVLFGVLATIVTAYSIFIFLLAYPNSRAQILDSFSPFSVDAVAFCILGVVFGVLPTFLLIMGFVQGLFSVITIDSFGVRRALFGKFCKRQMTWDEVVEIRFYPRVTPYILFTNKDLSNENLFFKNVIAHKNIIAVEMRKKVLDAIERFTDKEIVGLPNK